MRGCGCGIRISYSKSFYLRFVVMFVVVFLITLRNFHWSATTTTSIASTKTFWTADAPAATLAAKSSTTTKNTITTTTPIYQTTIADSTKQRRPEEETSDIVHHHFIENVTWETLLAYPSPLKDKTVPWYTNIPRYWWDLDQNITTIPPTSRQQQQQHRPPAMLLLTKYGWNQRNQWHGRTMLRSLRQRELLIGLLQHEWFHPTFWDDVLSGRRHLDDHRPNDDDVRYYIFLDVETCADKNYPHYLQRTANQDKLAKRGMKGGNDHVQVIQQALQTPFFQNTTTSTSTTIKSRIILWDCNTYSGKLREKQSWRRRYNRDKRLVLASLTAHENDIIVNHDVGLPPPACNPCHLSLEELQDIENCVGDEIKDDSNNTRPYLITFTGNFRSRTRQALLQLHNGQDILIVPPTNVTQYMNETTFSSASSLNLTASFQTMAKRSKFSAVPRGDNLFSYRFTEVISCGSIPVVYADGWVFPFHPVLAPPNDYAVIILEHHMNDTRRILSNIPPATQCRMRRRGQQLYQQYLKGGAENVRGIIDTLELMHAKNITAAT